jgi:hypothetical protein
MKAPLQPVHAGQPLQLSAADWNAMLEAARAYQLRGPRATSDKAPQPPPTATVYIQNKSGADRDRFDVLGVDAPLIDPADNLDEFQHRVALAGVAPTAADHLGRFAILAEPLRDNAIGRAWVSGVFPARVNVTDEGHRFADVADGDATQLASADAGVAQILWAQAGTGTLWAIVRIGGGSAGTEPVGQYLGMAHLVVAQNTGGWDFIRYSAPLS